MDYWMYAYPITYFLIEFLSKSIYLHVWTCMYIYFQTMI